MLAGQGRGAPARGLGRNIHNNLFPFGVSTVFGETLSEAELRGLEGRCVRARHFGNSVASLIELAGIERGAQALGLDLFFFFDKF